MRVDARAIAQKSADDPRAALYEALGAGWESIEVFHNLLLVATHVRPEKTAGGIILTDRSLKEDEYQGKAHLVLKMGPLAFKDDSVAKFGDVKVELGDWVFIRPSDGIAMYLGAPKAQKGICVRIIEDSLIRGRVPDPTMLW